jgi:hypothetical protein
MWQYKYLILVIFSIVCITTSCSDDEGEFARVSIVSINQNGRFDFGDTLIVEADILNKSGAVVATVLDGSKPLGLKFETFSVVGDRHIFFIYANDRYLPSKNYDVRITAFNGENRASDFESVFINELPARLRGICYVTEDNNGSLLYKLDSVGIRTTIPLSGYSFDKIESDNRNGEILLAPSTIGPVEGYDFNKLTQLYSTFQSPISSVFYENLLVEGVNNFAFLRDGRTLGYSRAGGSFQRFVLPDNFLPKVAGFDGSRIAVGAQQQGTGVNKLFLLRTSNSFLEAEVAVTAEIVDIEHFENEIYFLLYVKNDQTIVAEFNRISGLISERYTLDNQEATDLVIYGNNGFIATDKSLFSFLPGRFQLPNQLFDFSVTKMEFDEVNNELYFTNGTTIWKTPLGSVQNQFVTSSGSTIKDFSLVYNK